MRGKLQNLMFLFKDAPPACVDCTTSCFRKRKALMRMEALQIFHDESMCPSEATACSFQRLPNALIWILCGQIYTKVSLALLDAYLIKHPIHCHLFNIKTFITV